MSRRVYLITFISALVLFAFGSAVNNSIFNNYLDDVFHYSAEQRGLLELPRELPGLLVTFTIGIFFFISEMRFLGVSCLVAALGILGIGYWSPQNGDMLFWVFIWSTGVHVQMVLLERLALEVGLARGKGHGLGRVNGLRSLGMILGALFVMAIASPLSLRYEQMFLTAAVAMGLGGCLYLVLGRYNRSSEVKRTPFVFKKRYSRYFILAALFGVRKQIFITFAPWFLVKILEFKAQNIAQILLISAAIGVFLKPQLGKLIDQFGERRILMADGVIISVFCLGYVVFPQLFSGWLLIILCCGCYILDELLFTLRTARTTWLAKIAETPEDVTGTMSVSVSIDHVLSMSISWVAGIAWLTFGYQVVFLFCVVIALLMTFVSSGIKS